MLVLSHFMSSRLKLKYNVWACSYSLLFYWAVAITMNFTENVCCSVSLSKQVNIPCACPGAL